MASTGTTGRLSPAGVTAGERNTSRFVHLHARVPGFGGYLPRSIRSNHAEKRIEESIQFELPAGVGFGKCLLEMPPRGVRRNAYCGGDFVETVTTQQFRRYVGLNPCQPA